MHIAPLPITKSYLSIQGMYKLQTSPYEERMPKLGVNMKQAKLKHLIAQV